jgi:hypothetical protein
MFPRESPYLPLLQIILGLGVVYLVLVCGVSSAPHLFALGICVLIVLVLAAILYVFFAVIRAQVASRWGAPRTLPARVERKWTEERDLDLPLRSLGQQVALATDQDPGIPLAQSWDFWVGFDLGGERQEEFRVPESVYVGLEEDMEGYITFRGERLLRFVPASHPEDQPLDSSGEASQWQEGPHLPRKQ